MAARGVLTDDPAKMRTVLSGGDDYEILFAARPETADELSELSRALQIPITAIGRMASPPAGKGGRITVLDESGKILNVDRAGWTHF
jgi:thiamine-monophosphate kinase